MPKAVYENKFISVKLIRYQFWCTRCAFRLINSLQYSGQKSWKTEKKKEIVKTVQEPKNTGYCAMKLSQICRRIVLCMRDIILCFRMNLWNLLFFSKFFFIFLFLSKYRSKYLLGCRDSWGLTVYKQRPWPRG
jgi:hypothetical protein